MKKNQYRIGVGILFFCFLFLVAGSRQTVWAAQNETSLILSNEEKQANREGTWTTRISFSKAEVERLSAFRLIVTYDSNYLTLKKTEGTGAMESGDFRYLLESSRLVGIYASAKQEINWEQAAVTLTFQINEEAPSGTTEICAEMDQRVDTAIQEMAGKAIAKTSLQIVPVQEEHAFLTGLIPSEGKLEPVFSSDVLEYQMTVPYETSTMTFEATPGENGAVRVNRKNLNRAGVPTVFLVTVTSESGKEQTQYVVTVTREEKKAGEAGTISSSSSSAKGAGGGTSSQKAGKETDKKSTASQKTTAAGGKSGDTPQKEEEAEVDLKEEEQPAQQAARGERNLYMAGNQMPTFVIGILCACVCGLSIAVVFLIRGKKEKIDRTNKKEEEKEEESKKKK